MPAQKSAKPATSAKPAAKTAAKTDKKAPAVPASKSKAAPTEEVVAKKKPGRPPKAAAAESSAPAKTGAKRGRKPKAGAAAPGADADDLEIGMILEFVVDLTQLLAVANRAVRAHGAELRHHPDFGTECRARYLHASGCCLSS